MNKRVWSIAVALVMLFSMVCSAFVVSATDDVVRILYSSESVSVGDALEATVQLNNYASDWNDPTILLDYDPAVLELVSADTSVFGAEGTYTEEQKGAIKAVWAYQSTENRTAFDAMKLTFKVIGTEGDTSLKATLQVGETVAEANVPFQIEKQIILSQEATLLADDGNTTASLENAATGGPTTLELTAKVNGVATTEIKPGAKFTLDVSLGNYNGNWAIFAADIFYDTNVVEYAEGDSIEFETEDFMVMVNKVEDGKLTITVLSMTGDNIEAGSVFATLNFKVKSGNDVTNRDKDSETLYSLFKYKFDGNNIAGYTNEGSEIIKSTDATNGYKEGVIVPLEEEQVTITPPVYLSIRMGDEGVPEQGNYVYAYVTLNNYYDPWSSMTLSLDYDINIFDYVAEGEDEYEDEEDLGAFGKNGEMILSVAETGNAENPMNINFLSPDLSNRALAGGESSADILRLKFKVSATAKTGDASIDVSFTPDSVVPSGNMMTGKEDPEDPNSADVYEILIPGVNANFTTDVAEEGSASVNVTGDYKPELSLVDKKGDPLEVLKVTKGSPAMIYVKVSKYVQNWSAMSIALDFDPTVYSIDKAAVEAANRITDSEGNDCLYGEFGDYVVAQVNPEKGVLGVTLLNMTGVAGLRNGSDEGIILAIPLNVKEDADLSKATSPVLSFLPGGNMSGNEPLDDEAFSEKPDKIETVSPIGKTKVTVDLAPNQKTKDLVAGDLVKYVVSVGDFGGEWSAMTLKVMFNADVFEFYNVTDSDPFGAVAEGRDYYYFSAVPTEKTNDDNTKTGYILATWFNGLDCGMVNSDKQEVMTFTLKVKENYKAVNKEQAVSVEFYSEGNYAGNVQVPESGYNPDPDKVEVEVKENDPEQPEEPITYQVTIAWESNVMQFTYNYGTWNPAKHAWEGRGWVPTPIEDNQDTNWITVTNQCEKELTATFAFVEEDAVSEWLDGYFYQGESKEYANYEVPVGTGENAVETVHFGLEGEPEGSMPEGVESVTLGTIKVTIDVANE